MELELQPLELPHKENQPIIIAGPCSAETERAGNGILPSNFQPMAARYSVQVFGNHAPDLGALKATAKKLCLG